MIRPRGPAVGASSKATPQTLCQKCLKRGHFSYECKSAAQDRPYVSRPSRTQQLADPKLVPKLASDIPNDLLRKYVGQLRDGWAMLIAAQEGCCRRTARQER
ncbi:hypothetical protein BGHDH14_bgh01719 [Lasallia pustulata]|uniref:Zinc finger, CCHC-type n=1 Tax=Lasallia pustulata TaxID=136370 RepID=A0A1W5CTW1_9LECA|nr:hypothetical protein BGHDH14_bgh01719 [Lasallia pustulata]